MKHRRPKPAASPHGLEKAPTGIRGLDEIKEGGLPRRCPNTERVVVGLDLVERKP